MLTVEKLPIRNARSINEDVAWPAFGPTLELQNGVFNFLSEPIDDGLVFLLVEVVARWRKKAITRVRKADDGYRSRFVRSTRTGMRQTNADKHAIIADPLLLQHISQCRV